MKTAWLLVGVILASVAATQTLAQAYPSKPIRLISPFAPGGGTDILGRMIAVPVSEALGQTVVVDNRPGAGGAIGAEMTVRAEPDGYTLIMVSSSYTATSAFQKLSYDPVNDIQPIVLIGTTGLIMPAHPSIPVKSVEELVTYARANPGKLNYASVGIGSVPHLMFEYLKLQTKINLVHIPYKGSGPALNALIAGEVPLSALSMVPTLPHVKAGRLRALAITSDKRSPLLPEVPTIGETVPGFEVIHWYGIWGPKGLPKNIVARWNREVAKVLQTDEMQRRLKSEGLEPGGGPPQQFQPIIKRDVEKWKRVIREAKIKRAG